MEYRLATDVDADAITDTITLAFADDPIWAPALAGRDGATSHIHEFWRVFVDGALRFNGAYVVGNADAVALWTPPGVTEITEEQDAEAMGILERALDAQQFVALRALFALFDEEHPHESHAYLGFLATHPAHRGRGIAQQLLAENLKQWDAQGIPTYLESSNPVNDHRYERAGFRQTGTFSSPINGAEIHAMWRNPA